MVAFTKHLILVLLNGTISVTKSFYLRAKHNAAESNQGIKRAPKL